MVNERKAVRKYCIFNMCACLGVKKKSNLWSLGSRSGKSKLFSIFLHLK